jgi:hypothetical protein
LLKPRAAERPAALRRGAQAVDDGRIERRLEQRDISLSPFAGRAAERVIERMRTCERLGHALPHAHDSSTNQRVEMASPTGFEPVLPP